MSSNESRIYKIITSGDYRTDPFGNVLTTRGVFNAPSVERVSFGGCEWVWADRLGKSPRDRKRIWIDGGRVLSHRVVWALDRGCVPSPDVKIVHRDGNHFNNAPSNLHAQYEDGSSAEPSAMRVAINQVTLRLRRRMRR